MDAINGLRAIYGRRLFLVTLFAAFVSAATRWKVQYGHHIWRDPWDLLVGIIGHLIGLWLLAALGMVLSGVLQEFVFGDDGGVKERSIDRFAVDLSAAALVACVAVVVIRMGF